MVAPFDVTFLQNFAAERGGGILGGSPFLVAIS
ncbi:hypothetical protein [Brenneria corticis]|uniref:Uncharacterized protein n=1 Tax=Brenneria corticis TaxID=2173106 RepID=A0A2U1UDF1_9GAMM|nr:hypothetical protein DDT56_01640 [Brenneria sp. CFCC 11842]